MDIVRAVRGTIAVRLGGVNRQARIVAGCAVALLLVVPAVAWLLGLVESTPYTGPERPDATAPFGPWQQALNDVSSGTVADEDEAIGDEDAAGHRESWPDTTNRDRGPQEDGAALLPSGGSLAPRDSDGLSAEPRAGTSDSGNSGGSSGSGRGGQGGSGSGGGSDRPSTTTTPPSSSPTTAPGSGGDDDGVDDGSDSGSGLIGDLVGGLVGGVTGLLSLD